MASGGCNGDDVLRVVLLGKTGAGKSSLGNSLTGYKPPRTASCQQRDDKGSKGKDPTQGFNVGRGLKAQSLYCGWSKADRMVTDTPGLCDTHLDEGQIYREVAKGVAVSAPHVIIFPHRIDRRFTDEEYRAFKKIQEMFSEGMNKYLILVFNGMDCYIDDEEDTPLEEQRQCLAQDVVKLGDQLNKMIQKAGNRFFGMNNKATGQEKDRQINDLIHMMKDMVKSNGQDCFYKSPTTDEIMKKVEKMAEEEARAKGQSVTKIRDEVKAKIIREEVDPGFVQSFMDWGAWDPGAWEVDGGVSDMCSVM